MNETQKDICIFSLAEVCGKYCRAEQYAFYKGKENAVCLRKSGDTYKVCKFSGTIPENVKEYDTVLEACEDMLGRLSTPENRREIKNEFYRRVIRDTDCFVMSDGQDEYTGCKEHNCTGCETENVASCEDDKDSKIPDASETDMRSRDTDANNAEETKAGDCPAGDDDTFGCASYGTSCEREKKTPKRKNSEASDGKTSKNSKVGETRYMNCGLAATITAYRSMRDIDVRFEDGAESTHKEYTSFKRGEIGHPKNSAAVKRKERIGEARVMNNGMKATITGYTNRKNITVQFEDGLVRNNVTYDAFERGKIAHKE